MYNKIISLTRKKFFYTEISLKDDLITRLYLVLFHLGFILELLKKLIRQYGLKKGKSVFYAMENSRKLKGVKKKTSTA